MDHERLVEAVCAEVRARPQGKQLTVRKRRPGHTPHDYGYKTGKHAINVTKLDRVLEIDREQRIAMCEGEVSMGQLCSASLPFGLVPAVVPELETFTVAGLINGLGLETSAHREGIFPMNVPWFDIVLGNGERVRCSATEHADLFRAVPGCYGTLGIVTRAAVHLIEAKRYVHSRYRHFERVSDYVAAFGKALDEHQYVEGFIMGPDSHVLITGDFADEGSGVPVYHAMQAGNLWYYEHAAKLARRNDEDLVPTYEYVFRHMRSLLWVSRFANFLYLPMTRLGRFLLDTRVMQELHEYGLVSAIPHDERERSVVMQDTAISLDRLEAGIEYAKKNFGVYPFWNCAAGHAQRGPYSKAGGMEMHFITNHRLSIRERQELDERARYMVDIGLYGEPTAPNFRHHSAIRALQNFVDVPAMWGMSYLSRGEYRSLYDIAGYEKIRANYHAEPAFPHIEEKTLSRESTEPELAPTPLWRFSAFMHRIRNPGRGI